MFGAKLDAGFAGTRASNPKVIRAVLKAYEDKRDTEGSYASNDEQAEIFYASAVEKMNKGFYDDAVKRLNRASYFAGVASRRGGQMQLWLGQALYAAGRRGDALKLLLALKAHPDRDVAKVSKELVFILKAPELQLDESSRVGFDMDNFDAEAKFERAPDGTIKIMKRPEFEKPPEYGSVRSRRPAVPSLPWMDSCPSDEVVGGFCFDFDAPRRSSGCSSSRAASLLWGMTWIPSRSAGSWRCASGRWRCAASRACSTAWRRHCTPRVCFTTCRADAEFRRAGRIRHTDGAGRRRVY